MKYNKNRDIMPKKEVRAMDYLTAKEVRELCGITSRMVTMF